MSGAANRPDERLTEALRAPAAEGRAALVGFVTGGFPSRATFADALAVATSACDVVEVGIPFSDPMADGLTIQRASEQALKDGTTLDWIFTAVEAAAPATPLVFMSYLNPILQMGYADYAARCVASGVCGTIVPDLPFEECEPLRQALDAHGVALIQLVTPATPAERRARLCAESRGFVYAVTMTGITGADVSVDGSGVARYLADVRAQSQLPVMAGFGIRTPEDVQALVPHADGVIVGSALVEALGSGGDAAGLLRALREATYGLRGSA